MDRLTHSGGQPIWQSVCFLIAWMLLKVLLPLASSPKPQIRGASPSRTCAASPLPKKTAWLCTSLKKAWVTTGVQR